jgi:hypothetical protein
MHPQLTSRSSCCFYTQLPLQRLIFISVLVLCIFITFPICLSSRGRRNYPPQYLRFPRLYSHLMPLNVLRDFLYFSLLVSFWSIIANATNSGRPMCYFPFIHIAFNPPPCSFRILTKSSRMYTYLLLDTIFKCRSVYLLYLFLHFARFPISSPLLSKKFPEGLLNQEPSISPSPHPGH